MGPLHIKIAALIAIAVDVNGGMLPQLVCVLFHPLGGTEKHGLFAIPGGVDDGAFRLPSLLGKFPKRARLLQQHHLAGNRIVRAVDPRIVMVAAQHPEVGLLRAAHGRDHVVNRFQVPVESKLQMNLSRAGPKR
jgi:hypothetical protein